MDALLSLWTFMPAFKIKLVVIALIAQVFLTIWCYMQMSKARVKAAKSGAVSPDIYVAVGDAEPEELRVYTRLVANQFESPVLFYAMIVAGLAIGVTSWLTVVLAFLYVWFRYRHAKEMTGEHVVLRRRKIFVRSFQVLLIMVADLLVSTLFALQV